MRSLGSGGRVGAAGAQRAKGYPRHWAKRHHVRGTGLCFLASCALISLEIYAGGKSPPQAGKFWPFLERFQGCFYYHVTM